MVGETHRRGILVALAAVAALVIAAPSALAADTHVFDEGLSLTGGCTTSLTDPMADPGCPEGDHPPSGSFVAPTAVATDSHGNIYVASYGKESAAGAEGRIDIFDAEGNFITELLIPNGPMSLAVDSKGNLYVFERKESIDRVQRYSPIAYEPASGEIDYGAAGVLVAEKGLAFLHGIAVNGLNDHLFVHFGNSISEYSSAEEENKLLDSTIGEGSLSNVHGLGLAVDAAHGRIYASTKNENITKGAIRVFELEPPHAVLMTIDGSTAPAGVFGAKPSVAVDEGSGHFFVYDGEGENVVFEFTATGEYVSTIEHNFKYVFGAQIAIDNGVNSPNGALNPDGRYLFVPSHPSGVGHLFAFGPVSPVCAPEIDSVSFDEVTRREAELRAKVNPCGDATHYLFQYTTQESFEEEGFVGAVTVGEGDLPAGKGDLEVSASTAGLLPGTEYRFRVVAENECEPEGCMTEEEGVFSTYPEPEVSSPCPNDPLRGSSSLLLPDCRAYELVTPSDTNGRAPIGVDHLGIYFGARQASPAGDKVSFLTEGGSIPGEEGTGSWGGDTYVSTRGAGGWSTARTGPTGSESVAPLPGSTSPDQGYSFWEASGEGSAAVEGKPATYVRYPDGHSELVGRGEIGTDPRAEGKLISENGGHIIFKSSVKLEEAAPSSGTMSIYDRTADEVTHVVSLLPGDLAPAAGENATYMGASLDGEGVAFKIGTKLYLRHDNEATYEIGEGVTFAGVAEGGGRIFYVEGGDLFAFDVATDSVIPFSSSGDVTVVNVAAEGAAAYFTAPSVLVGEANPEGAFPQAGQENLYLSEEGAISFVGTVAKRDVEGDLSGNDAVEGLGLWTTAVGPSPYGGPGRFGEDPSRTTPDGSVLLFEARASLTGYDSEGHAQVYRYDSANVELDCLSCNPTQAPASSAASLQTVSQGKGTPAPFSSYAIVNNLRADGRRAFFQSAEPLVLDDTDGLQDVYEWEGQGVGTCVRPGGCIYLISSGHSDRVDYLFAVSDSGDDVFFRSADLLTPFDTERTPSIYDARLGGGFASPSIEEDCFQADTCRLPLGVPPALTTPAAPAPGADDNVPRKQCAKGKRKVRRGGKVLCVKKQRKHRRHKAGGTRKGADR